MNYQQQPSEGDEFDNESWIEDFLSSLDLPGRGRQPDDPAANGPSDDR